MPPDVQDAQLVRHLSPYLLSDSVRAPGDACSRPFYSSGAVFRYEPVRRARQAPPPSVILARRRTRVGRDPDWREKRKLGQNASDR